MDNSQDIEQVTIAITVAYNGEPFCGFAKQPGQLTVQGSIEEALALIFRHPVETVCSGRTDSGVHAKGQVVSFTLMASEWFERSEYKLLRSLNALTHEDISVLSIERRDLDFSARFSATMREYRYFICTDKAAPLLMRDFSWHLAKDLDIDAMNEAAAHLIGEHDFKSFCMAASAEGKSTSRNVFSIKVKHQQLWGEHLVVITVKGNAFLHSMVRTIVGTLVAVGAGQRTPDWVGEVLAACDRRAAGENAPAKGLVFWRVSYDGERVHDPRKATGAASSRETKKSSAQPLHLPFGIKREPEMVIPRGDGVNVISGSAYSDVKHASGEGLAADDFDVATEYEALRQPGVARPLSNIADGGYFGEVIWDNTLAGEMDEPVIQGFDEGEAKREESRVTMDASAIVASGPYPFQRKE